MNEIFIPAEIHPQRAGAQRKFRPFTGGPRPDGLILTCSDCTLDEPLARFFEEQPVFILRTFGNEVAEFIHAHEELIEALEEAVCWWQVPQIIVCGHSGCRGIPGGSTKTGDAAVKSSDPKDRFQSMLQRIGDANQNLEAAKQQTIAQLGALRSYPFIENAIHEQDLELSALFYLHPSSLFLHYDESQGGFCPLM